MQNKDPPQKKKYYEPLYGKPECPYKGNKKGRKSYEELQELKVKVKKGLFIMYFD